MPPLGATLVHLPSPPSFPVGVLLHTTTLPLDTCCLSGGRPSAWRCPVDAIPIPFSCGRTGRLAWMDPGLPPPPPQPSPPALRLPVCHVRIHSVFLACLPSTSVSAYPGLVGSMLCMYRHACMDSPGPSTMVLPGQDLGSAGWVWMRGLLVCMDMAGVLWFLPGICLNSDFMQCLSNLYRTFYQTTIPSAT